MKGPPKECLCVYIFIYIYINDCFYCQQSEIWRGRPKPPGGHDTVGNQLADQITGQWLDMIESHTITMQELCDVHRNLLGECCCIIFLLVNSGKLSRGQASNQSADWGVYYVSWLFTKTTHLNYSRKLNQVIIRMCEFCFVPVHTLGVTMHNQIKSICRAMSQNVREGCPPPETVGEREVQNKGLT